MSEAQRGRPNPGKRGKVTPLQAAEIKERGKTESYQSLGKEFGLSPQRVGDLVRGKGFLKPRKAWVQIGGRIYSRVTFLGRSYSLGSFSTPALAENAYNRALARLHSGEEPKVRTRRSAADARRFYNPATVGFDGDGRPTIQSQPEQETSSFLMYRALERLPAKARDLLISLTDTGDLQASADSLGLSQSEVDSFLPLLKEFIRPETAKRGSLVSFQSSID